MKVISNIDLNQETEKVEEFLQVISAKQFKYGKEKNQRAVVGVRQSLAFQADAPSFAQEGLSKNPQWYPSLLSKLIF